MIETRNVIHTTPARLGGWGRSAALLVGALLVVAITIASIALRPPPSLDATRGAARAVLTADRAAVVSANGCVVARWTSENAEAVRLSGAEVALSGEAPVCLDAQGGVTLTVRSVGADYDLTLPIAVLTRTTSVQLAAGLALALLLGAVALLPPVERRLRAAGDRLLTNYREIDSQVPTASLMERTVKALRLLLLAAALLFILMYLGVALARLHYPYALEWMEGAAVDAVARIRAGEPLYTRPSIEYVPTIYGPVYFYAAAFVSWFTGMNYVAVRLVSLLASLGCLALVYDYVRRETRGDESGGTRPDEPNAPGGTRPTWSMFDSINLAGLAAAGLFAAMFQALGGWFDLARVDTLFLCLLLLGVYGLRFWPTPGGWALAGAALALSALTKQSALIVIAFVCLYALISAPRRALALFAALALVVGGMTLVFDYASGGWFDYFIFGVGDQEAPELSARFGFWSVDLALVTVAAVLGLIYIFWQLAAGRRDAFRWYALLTLAMIITSWLSRLRSGTWLNGLFPAYAMLAMLFGLGLYAVRTLLRDAPVERRAPLEIGVLLLCLLQFGVLAYNPLDHLPTEADRAAGDAFIETLRAADGEVLLLTHGHYATLAGRDAPQLGWAMVILSGLSGQIREQFIDEMNQALAEQRFALIVADQYAFFVEPFYEALDTYYVGESAVFADDDAFRPVTGMPTRPLWLYRPRAQE